MRLGAFLGMVAGVVVAAFVATLMLPHAPYIRYQSFQGTIYDRLGWTYDRLAHDPTPIDVLFVGSSRTARGADAAGLQAALADRGMPDIHIANISEPAAGIDIRYTKIREAFETHPEIRLIVLGVAEALPRDGHQAFGDLATPGEILTAPWIVNRTLPANIAALPYRQMELALATALPEAFGYHSAFDPDAYPGPTPDHRRFNSPDWSAEAEAARATTDAHAREMAEGSRRRRAGITPPVLPDSLAWIEFGVSRTYIRRIADLAADHDAEIAFLFLPFYRGYMAPQEAGWLDDFGPVWAGNQIIEDPRYYADSGHVSPQGLAQITPWLADRLATALTQETPQ